MNLSISWARSAVKDALRLDAATRTRVRAGLQRFAQTGHGDVKRLQATRIEEYRLRVADWRVRFTVDWESRVLTVLRVVHRSDAY